MQRRNHIRKFLIDSADTRGHWVRLNSAWQQACERISYPEQVRQVLGEAFAAAALMAATIKYDGKLTLQVRGEGPIHLLLVQVDSNGALRGLARWTELPASDSLQDLFGSNARMSITIKSVGQPYQGIVELQGKNLSEALGGYFRESEQLPTELILAVSANQVTGLLLQKLPGQAVDSDGWTRVQLLAETVRNDEMQSLEIEDLLHRLFHQETVHLHEPTRLRYACSCSRERTDHMIRGLGETEAQAIVAEEGSVQVTCEFCAAEYHYDAVDIAGLFTPADRLAESESTLVQ